MTIDVIATLAANPRGHSVNRLTSTLHRLIRTGDLPPGTKLPTVREVAAALNVSPALVSEAWQVLQRSGAIRTEGRRGSFVIGAEAEPAPPRFWRTALDVGRYPIDLSSGVPDAELLPDIRPVLGRLAATATVGNYLEPSVLPSLAEELRRRWSPLFVPEALVVVDGALDALDRVCRELIGPGDRVLVETPSLPTIYDTIEDHGGTPVPIPLDEEGMLPEVLRQALVEHRPRLVVLQPRAQNPTGISMSRVRARELAAAVATSDAMVFEDDHCGDVSWAPLASLAEYNPESTVVAQSFSKSHGPDLRLAAVAGPLHVIHRLSVRRRLGPSWSSRLLQSMLIELLLDPAATNDVARARSAYHDRRLRFAEALASNGIHVAGSDGINMWIEVANEEVARRELARSGIGVHAGSPFDFGSTEQQHIRVTYAAIAAGYDELAKQIAAIAATLR